LRTLVAELAARSGPDHVTFVLVDYKGGATFDACADLPHTVGVVTDLDERLAARALVSLEAELRRREGLFRAAGADDLAAYRATAGRQALPRLVVVIDEFAALAAELPQFLASLVGVAQRGRSLGLHLVLATQRPAGVVDENIRANTNLRIGLRLQDPADGRDVVGDPAPASFPRGTPGRAMLRLGPGETVVFQAARSGGCDLDVLVRSIRQAAALSDVGPVHRPWLPPLPAMIGASVALEPGDAGVLDDPAAQCQRALRWKPEDGHLALLGGRRSGTTTALRTLIATVARERAPAYLHAYVIDARGDDRLDDLDQLASCGAVVRPHERERLGRLLRRLVEELDVRRRAGGRGDRPHVVLAVDGLPHLAAALDGATDELELLARIIAEGATLGVACVLTAPRPGAVPVSTLAACSERWVFRLDDPAEAPLCGVPAVAVATSVPGRVVVASSGLEAQLAVSAVQPGPVDASGGGPPPVGTLDADVDAAGLPPGRPRPDGETELVVGIEFHSLEPARLTVPDGEHVLVAGPPRSGRSTTLIRLADSWRDAHPGGITCCVAPLSRSPLAARPDAVGWEDVVAVAEAVGEGCPCLVLVDDAERVDDASGAVAALVADRRPGLLVIAAGRPDALRVQYGQWTNVIRRSRTGLLMSSCADTDGDVLGELLPRRPPIPPRPGLAWVVSGGVRALAQVGRRRS
jgi:DNA segregation ATPase FtsK/SpoIIIE, S-DNA-T family